MPQHLTLFAALREQYHSFYRTLYQLSQEEEAGTASAEYMATLRSLTCEKLAALRKTLDSIEREHGLVESEAGNG